jgi:hypothetical protein
MNPSAAEPPFRKTHPFDGFDTLTAGRLRMALGGVERAKVLGGVEGQPNDQIESSPKIARMKAR